MLSTLNVLVVLSCFIATSFHSIASPVQDPPAGVNVWDVSKVFEPGSKIPDKGELGNCVDTAAKKLGIDMNMKTDPALLKEILEKNMHLQDLPSVQTLVAKDLTQSQDLRTMLEKVRLGVTETHPAIGVTICAALADKKVAAVFSAPNAALIKRTIHHMFLLEKIVEKLAADKAFLVEAYKHMQSKVTDLTGPSRLNRMFQMFKAAGAFGVAKDYSVNLGIENFMKLREAGTVTTEEANDRIHNLSVNIFEATVTDFLHGYVSNSRVGKRLAWMYPTNVEVVGPNKIIQYGLSMNWARLYETWNLAFITANLDFPNLLFPKLLIPRVLLASGKDYIYNRALALWLSIEFYLLAGINKEPVVTLPGKADLASLWGKINLRYADYIAAEEEKSGKTG